MATRIRTLNFLPEIFKTPTNSQFLNATLDQIVDQPNLERIQGYIGSKLGYGINAKNNYVTEPTKTRTDYQLDPGVVFNKTGTGAAQDFISYPGIIDALSLEGGVTNNNNRLFNGQFYSWDSFTDLDKIINFNQYYWLPAGPSRVNVSSATVYNASAYIVTDVVNGYNITVDGQAQGVTNPTITLLRGGTYTFAVNQSSQFWIQGVPGVTGYSVSQPNLQTRDVFGVDNNGSQTGFVTFNVPTKNSQDEYNFPGNNLVDVVSTLPYDQINGALVSDLENIDGITALNGLTLMFYDTGVAGEQGFISTFYDTTTFDQIDPALVDGFGNYDGGYYTDVSATFYTITYIGNAGSQTIRLVESGSIPTNQKITASYGTEWISRTFYRNIAGTISLVPYISAILDTLYYQDGTSANKVGVLKIIDSNVTNTLNILTEVLGQKTFTSTDGVVFTNGLQVVFSGDVYPTSYKNVPYYVEGVGTAIELILVDDLIAPELFSASGADIPFDTLAYDIGNYDSSLYVPVTPDYITIARNAINRNAWSRSNRWFHIDVINATAEYNNNPNLVSLYATAANKAKRPIIEFYPNLRMFNSGVVGKSPVDFVDFRTADAFLQVAGKLQYYPDIEVYTDYTGAIGGTPQTPDTAGSFTVGVLYKITFLGSTNWNTVAGTSGITYSVGDFITPVVAGAGTGKALMYPTTTAVTISTSAVTGAFQIGQYITDSTNVLPRNAYITNITGTTTLTITVEWSNGASFASASLSSLVASDTTNDNFALFDGARVIFAADTNDVVRNKIYVSRFSSITPTSTPVITLTEADDGMILADNQTVCFRGYVNTGKNFYYDGDQWLAAQKKITVNQPPLFDIFDDNGISFGNPDYYAGTSFVGTRLFAYGIGSGTADIVLGFPLSYSSVNNVGDISFDVSLNSDTFTYVEGASPITKQINTGYVYNYSSLTEHVRQLGWQTAVSPSVQYQIFEFTFLASAPTSIFACDIALNSDGSNWPAIQLYVNNVLQSTSSYSYAVTDSTTIVSFTVPDQTVDTVIQILLLSDQVSSTAYYGIPTNLNNNPLNADITQVNIGDIRRQYQSIFLNNADMSGTMFGSNNYRDLGNVVPYGNSIIQNSASLVLPGAFLRKQNHNLFNALLFNSREYITFKTLLVNTVNNTEYSVYQSASSMLDNALDQITVSKTDSNSFFWSDMLPSKAAYISNTYSFANSLSTSIFPLSRIYDYTKANYYNVLVYLTRTTDGQTQTIQLIRNVDYTISATSPALTIQLDLLPGDQINIREYNQTYGSYVPNTPTKLGLYPATIPSVTLDSNYSQPTYFIVGHDGSYNKLYGDYDPVTGRLIDFRDQVLLEFEKRIYNNLKISAEIPIKEYEVLPGFFRDTGYSYEEILEIYSESFLNWVGQNRINYTTQYYSATNEFTYNYYQSGNKINKESIQPGYWRGVYEYFYDTSNPDTAPWEMLGFTNQPTWWETRYGPAPYTSDNLVLWDDLAQGIDWNNGSPVVITQAIRPELMEVLPVDSAGNLVSPFVAIVGNYANYTLQNDWKVGDAGPAEFSYRRSSSWPFDLMRILALTKPAEFFNLGVDLDNYKYNEEFGQYLVNNISHLKLSDIEIYGSGTAKTSYINWIVDFEKQVGVDATQNIKDLFSNIDVRLVYRLAGFSDKNMLKFYVEKGTPNSNNSSLLIPDESYSVLLYDNQPFDRIVYSSVIIQITERGYKVYGNSQTSAYFTVLKPKINGNYDKVEIEKTSVQVANDYYDTEVLVPYGTEFYSVQEVSQFLSSYGRYLESRGMVFDQIESGLEVNWRQMVAEFVYWAQTGWEIGSIVNINPAATYLSINKDSNIVQPLTLRQQNFVLNQNLYPIQSTDLAVVRDGTLFSAAPTAQGDTISYGTFNISNFEHGIVFDNVTLFDDVIYNLTTGLRQNRIVVKGSKTAEWNGTIDPQGFILNQDNIQEWNKESKYTTGSIVKYKNKYWIAVKIVQAAELFDEQYWKQTDYNEIQKGLLPNPSTRSYESTLYYDVNTANLESDADLLSFSLIGYRPRDYMALADLTDITQVNVYKNLIKNKGTLNAASVFKGAQLSQGGIDYDIYENWAIQSGELGGVLNSNFIEFKLSESELSGNPSIVSLTDGVIATEGAQQEVPLYSLYNYGRQVTDPGVLPLSDGSPASVFPDAGYVNFNDVKMSSFYYSGLATARDASGAIVPLSELYVRDYVWLANYQGTWQTYTPTSLGQVIYAKNNLNGTVTITFKQLHNLSKYSPFAIAKFNPNIDGYYIVSTVVNPYSVTVSLNLNPGIVDVTSIGIGFKFQSQRVSTPSEINTLPLLDSEFRKNTVWVDTNSDGNWAVYRKGINYTYDAEITKTSSVTFGSAVAYTPGLGYLVGDAGKGQIYRYSYNALTTAYDLVQTLPLDTSPPHAPITRPPFGAAISYADDMFVISEPTGATAAIHIYKLFNTAINDDLVLQQTILAPSGATNWGSATAISGDTNWLYVSDIVNNSVHVYRRSALTSLYETSHIIDGDALALTTSGDNFGYAITTDYSGDTIIIGTPDKNYDSVTENWGYTYVFNRTVQNFEAQYTNSIYSPQTFSLVWTPTTIQRTVSATIGATDRITVSTNTTGFVADMPVIFSGIILSGSGISANKVYYIESVISGTQFRISETRGGSVIDLSSTSGTTMYVNVQSVPLFVNVNGTALADNTYAVIGSTLNVLTSLTAGDIVNVSGNNFVLAQTLTTETTPRIGVQFGLSVDTTSSACEILVGAPFELNSQQTNNQNIEGAVYRFTNGGCGYGMIIGTEECNITSPITILLNGYSMTLPIGNATSAAAVINNVHLTNITASATDNKLIISLIDVSLATPNDKLNLSVLDQTATAQLGITLYTQTQVINDPHEGGRTQFGSVVKFGDFDSFITSAPVSVRYCATTFDFKDDELDNDTVFDNNTTQWIDTFANAGAVYMFDYVSEYNESLANIGQFIYAQSVNDISTDYGAQPMYGQALEFNGGKVVVGTPNFDPAFVNGQIVSYTNLLGTPDWSVYRSSSAVVDINRIQDIQMYSALTNTTLDNLDYIDPLQGKIIGAARENIDVVSNSDPAGYNSTNANGSLVWGAGKVGQIWFNTSSTRFVNYHQNDVVYNSKYWGTVFPGSDVAVYSWISSNVLPSQYRGPGTPFDSTSYTTEYVLSSTGALQPVYFYWVRNTNIIFTKAGKTLSDTIIESYINSPVNTGISYFAPLLPNTFALYNAYENINASDTVLHIGFSTGTNDDVSHSLYSLIRAGFADDFLPGLPGFSTSDIPKSLYNRMLCSLCGVDAAGAVVPNPYLPKPVQNGILVRPNQSFFRNRFYALKNYLAYANEVLAQYPIVETRQPSFLNLVGEDNPSTISNPNWPGIVLPNYDTPKYWSYINWWATGYSDNTKSALQVTNYAALSTIIAASGMIVTVAANGEGKSETYVYETTGTWTRIGLQDGTIEFSSSLWDYASARTGFGDNFFDTSPYDEYPSEETKNIIRSLNEEIYIDDLAIHRNKSLVLLFEYIQSETIESQNYLPWLNKTSFIDVSHTIRELLPIPVYQSDNQDFLSGYINEIKPYHVVIKEFLFKYTGTDVFEGDITDFDLPAEYNTSVERFITPQLVYSNPGENQYLYSDPIWQTAQYKSWYENYGLSITGVNDYQITATSSYIALNSNAFAVVNANGFPINGIVKIGNELIGYASVDRATSILSGLTRGVSGTEISTHLPGVLIYIDLPAILLLDGGRGYFEPPKVTAYIDTSIYPAPTTPAILKAVMNLDSVLSVEVIDPGQGYAVLPEIIIDPSITIQFYDTEVDIASNTISLSSPLLQTGDLVKYAVGVNTVPIGGLSDGQYYYVNVLESTPTFVVALYGKYAAAVEDVDRIKLYNVGSGSNNYLKVSARASCVSTAIPVRESQLSLRFDRTTYNSPVIDWITGGFYGSFFAGFLNDFTKIASSSISLESTQPPIESILASAQGAAFQISGTSSIDTLTWSSRTRVVTNTYATISTYSDVIRIMPSDGGSPVSTDQPIGSTIGFYIGMPVKFEGAVGSSGLSNSTTYYVKTLVELDDGFGNLVPIGFTVSATCVSGIPGPVVPLSNVTISAAGLTCYVGQPVSTAVVSIDYPGILQATNTTAATNIITVPLNTNSRGGTSDFYVGIPIFFVGSVFGGIIENETYYVTTIVSDTSFTMSKILDPVLINVTETATGTNIITCDSTLSLAINDPVIFNNMVVGGTAVSSFGGIDSGTTYYVGEIINGLTFKISAFINSSVINLSNETGTCLVTNQKDTVALTTASGSMTLNVGLPVSPGQITGQLFTFYPTSGIVATATPGITNKNHLGELARTVVNAISGTAPTGDYLAISNTSGGLTNFYIGMPVEFASGYAGFSAATTYWVTDSGTVTTTVTYTSSSSPTYYLTCDSTNGFYAGMPILLSGMPMGGLDLDAQYFVKAVINSTQFQVTDVDGGAVLALTTTSGSMTVTGTPYIRLNTAVGSTTSTTVSITQTPTGTPPTFTVSYVLGGYSVEIVNPGAGYTFDNTITILGSLLGGVDGVNDLVMTVAGIDSIVDNPNPILIPLESLGTITSVICAGTPAETVKQYYLKVISANDCEVYYDQLMKLPVAGVDFAWSLTNPGGYKHGDYALLPEPFYFDQSIVRFNHKLYRCIISNNDSEFIFGKWELLTAGDRTINALDRIIGYYQPTVNMPGLDLTQLVAGVTYPNSTYLGNAFAPDDEFVVDTLLQDKPFYPTEIDTSAVVWDGTKYLATADTPEYSAVLLGNATDNTWTIDNLSSQPLITTDILYSGSHYVITTNNRATPILVSADGITWSTNGQYTPYSSTPYDETSYDTTSLDVAAISLNSVAHLNGVYVAVGENIVTSTDTYSWLETFTFYNNGASNALYGVTGANLTSFTGFVAVGKGQRIVYSYGLPQFEDINAILVSPNGVIWNQLAFLTTRCFYGVISNNSNQIVTVGAGGVVYVSQNGSSWLGANETSITSVNSVSNLLNVTATLGFSINDIVRFTESFNVISSSTSYYVVAIPSLTQIQVSTTLGGAPITLNVDNTSTLTFMYLYPRTANLVDVAYGNSMYIAVGDTGLIRTSSDGLRWATQSSSVTDNLNGITYNDTDGIWIAVGDNNTIITSDDDGVTWAGSSVFTTIPTVYDVQGDAFMSGYGPEELVPGVINDNLTMVVTTRPGTNWSATAYAHVGYAVVSIELSPTSGSQVEYSFANVVTIPAQLSVFIIDRVTGLSTTIYQPAYSVDWLAKAITLATPLSFVGVGNSDRLRIDVYEVGNGDQLAKSNTQSTPVVQDPVTGFDEIQLNCNYSAPRFSGSGVIRPGTPPIEVEATETDSATDTIRCASVTDFSINDEITFQGVVFGNVVEDTSYFVKTISHVSKRITISETLISGIAGPTLELADDTGSMQAITQIGTGAVWSDPIVYDNGDKLVIGVTNIASKTKSSTNTVECNSTAGVYAGDPIVFDNNIFGGIVPQQTYYIKEIVDNNEFSISETLGGAIFALTDDSGFATFITNDYAFGVAANDISAILVFSAQHVPTDYITYTVFGETSPEQYGYTIPEVQTFTVQNTETSFYLSNYVSGDNPTNAIVEHNGRRLVNIADYVIDPLTNTVTLTFTTSPGDTVSVTSYNLTERQYLHTVYGGPFSGSTATNLVIGSTTHTVGLYDENSPSIELYDQDTPSIVSFDEQLDWLTLSSGSTSTLHINDAIIFESPTIGGIVAGEVYYVVGILSSTKFTVATTVGGVPITVTSASGSMSAFVNPATVANIVSINNAITQPIAITNINSTAVTNIISCTSTAGFLVDQPIVFKAGIFVAGSFTLSKSYKIVDLGTTTQPQWNTIAGTIGLTYTVGDIFSCSNIGTGLGTGTALLTNLGGISTLGVVYFVRQILSPGTFTINDENGNIISLTDDSGLVVGYVGGNPTVTIQTGVPHNLAESDLIRIDDAVGSYQLNNRTYYAKIISATSIALYTEPYDPAYNAINYPVTTVSNYISGGYVWLDKTFTLTTTMALATTAITNVITVQSTVELAANTPIIFTGTTFGNIVENTTYYVRTIESLTTFTISADYEGAVFELTTVPAASGQTMRVTQWEQTNVDRLWVTVNGYRVPSSSLYLNLYNNLSILTVIQPGDVVIITSMMPSATPNEMVYMQYVNKSNEGAVYRANNQTRTWLTETLTDTDSVIYVDDVSKITNTIIQNSTAPAAVDGVVSVGLTVDKQMISHISVYNGTTSTIVDSANYYVQVINLTPTLQITDQVVAGDNLIITMLEGNLLYVNGEQIRFSTVDISANSVTGIQRGANNTGIRTVTPIYSEVYGILSKNRMSDVLYRDTWNDDDYPDFDGDVDGGPLQISTTPGALFLLTGVNQ